MPNCVPMGRVDAAAAPKSPADEPGRGDRLESGTEAE
jgi:hypothetical protein